MEESRRAGAKRPLVIASLVIAVYLALEIAGAIISGSLALLADAAHTGSDIGALGLALAAAWVAGKPHTAQRSFGYLRAEVLSALALPPDTDVEPATPEALPPAMTDTEPPVEPDPATTDTEPAEVDESPADTVTSPPTPEPPWPADTDTPPPDTEPDPADTVTTPPDADDEEPPMTDRAPASPLTLSPTDTLTSPLEPAEEPLDIDTRPDTDVTPDTSPLDTEAVPLPDSPDAE